MVQLHYLQYENQMCGENDATEILRRHINNAIEEIVGVYEVGAFCITAEQNKKLSQLLEEFDNTLRDVIVENY